MGQKVHPNGFRVGVIRNWNTRWYASKKDYADWLIEDDKLRKYIKKTYYSANISRIDIERVSAKAIISIHTARPGMLLGKKGEDIEKMKAELTKLVGHEVVVNIIEVRNPDANAQLIAESIASQLEKRISYRRAMKQAMQRAMQAGAKGVKLQCGGRLGGAEIARSEGYRDGSIPLQTIRADIEYGFAEASTTYGRIGIKVWIYKGEILHGKDEIELERPRDRRGDRGDRRPRGDRDNRGGDRKPRRDFNGARGERREAEPVVKEANKEGDTTHVDA